MPPAADRAQLRIYEAAWRAKHSPEYFRAKDARYRATHPEQGHDKWARRYEKHRESILEKKRVQNATIYARRKALLLWLRDQPCWDCKRLYPWPCMEFDHTRGEKVCNINQISPTASNEVLQSELMKVDLVCSNCHCLRTHARRRRLH